MNDIISKSQYSRLPAYRQMKDEDLAVVSKLVKAKNTEGRSSGKNKPIDMPDMAVLGRIANKTATNNNDAINLFQVLPDMGLASSILVSAILSPTDMVSTALQYTLLPNKLDDNLTGPMLALIRDYFDDVYKIKKFLPEMLTDALFMKGAYPLLVMSETSIDYSINSQEKVTFESLSHEVSRDGWFTPYGLLGVPNTKGEYVAALESIWDTRVSPEKPFTKSDFSVQGTYCTEHKVSLPGSVHVTDNPNILSNPRLLDKLRKQRQGEIYGTRGQVRRKVPSGTTVSSENAELKTQAQQTLNATEKQFYLNRQQTPTPMQVIMTSDQLNRKNASHPLVMHLPSECVIPVHVPGDVRNHVAYFIITDVDGNPLSINYSTDYYNDVRSSIAGNSEMASQLLTMARQGTQGKNSSWGTGEIDQMQRAYQQSVETDLLNRLRSGAGTGQYELANCTEIYRMMFARSLSAKNTMLLYVPAELMTYITFDYNDHGVGKSLLEDGKILASLRSILLFASTMAAVKNASDTKNLNITIAEEDDQPYETLQYMLGEYAKINQNGFPIGETHPSLLVSHLQASGTVVTVQGNTAFPETKMEVESREGIHKAVDKELDDELRRRHIQTFGLTPETMEASSGADFATTVVNQHLMLLKRVIHYQEEFSPFLTDFVRRFTINSGVLTEGLLEIVKANADYLGEEYKGKEEEFVVEFINMLMLELPSPETNRLADQMSGYDTYTEAITKVIDAYINAAALDPISGQGLETHMDAIKASMITMYQRRYLREKNILPELDVFNTVQEEEGPAFNLLAETQDHLDGVLRTTESYVKRLLVEAKKRKKRADKLAAEVDAVASGSDDTDTEPAEGDDDLPPDDDFGGDGGDDFGGEAGDIPTEPTEGGEDLDALPVDDAADAVDAEPAEAGGDDELDLGVPADPDAPADAEPMAATSEEPSDELDVGLPADPDAPAEPEVADEEAEEVDLDIPGVPGEEEPADAEEEVPEGEELIPDELPEDKEDDDLGLDIPDEPGKK
jgi:hypothetical protein